MSDNPELVALIQEGERLIRSKLYDRAMVELNKALNLDSNETNLALVRVFEALQSSNDYDSIIAIGSNMLIHRPENTSLANLLGNSYRRIGNFYQAEKLYEHCLKYDPHHTNALYNLAATKAHTSLYDSNAVNAARSFEKMDWFQLPKKEDSTSFLASIDESVGLAMQAQEEGTESAELDPSHLAPDDPADKKNSKNIMINTRSIFHWLRQNKDMQDADSLETLRHLAIYCLHEKQTEIAWRSLAYLKHAYPDDQDLESFWALSYFLRELFYVCEDKLLRLLGANKYHRYANVNLSIFYKMQGKQTLARKYSILAHTLLERSMGHYQIDEFIALGERYKKQGSFANAVKVFEVVYQEMPTWQYGRILAELYLEAKVYDKAIRTFRELMDLENVPDNLENEFHEINIRILDVAEGLIHDQKLRRAAELFDLSAEIELTKPALQKALNAYNALHDKENIDRIYKQLQDIEKREKAREDEKIRREKISKAQEMIENNQFYPAIKLLESILFVKPDRAVLDQLTMLYKRTKQDHMIADAQKRFDKLVEQSKPQDVMV